MSDYKLYFIGQRGTIQARVDLQCAHDDDAIQVAEQSADGRPMELWELARFVKRFDPVSHAIRREA